MKESKAISEWWYKYLREIVKFREEGRSQQGFVLEALYLSGKNIKDAKVDYHDEMTGDIFFEWFSTKLLANLSANSVTVMENASYSV